MRLPKAIQERFRSHGRAGGRARAARLAPAAKQAIAQRAAASRWIAVRFGAASFAGLGLPGGALIDAGLAHLAAGKETIESLLVSLAAPRLRREGIPVGEPIADPDERLYRQLIRRDGDLAHARYLAYLRQVTSFADACRTARRDRGRSAP